MLGIGSADRSWGDVKKKQERDQLLEVTYLRSIVLCIHLLVLKNQGSEGLYMTHIPTMVHTVTLGNMMTKPSTIN